jgi:hypothetical protein
MRQLLTVFIFVSALWGGMEPAAADCLVRSQLDEMHQLQMRMVRNSNALFFGDEIRRLRMLSDGLGTPEVLRAVNGSRWVGHGAAFRQFLDNTNRLLVRASLDDPQSVRPHFDTKTQRNLQAIGGHMDSLRCTAEQINSARIAASLSQSAEPDAYGGIIPRNLIIAAILLVGVVILRIAFGALPMRQHDRANRARPTNAARNLQDDTKEHRDAT